MMNVLLVEDSNSDADLLTDFLSDGKQIPIIHRVTNGRDALDYVFQQGEFTDSQTPDVILLDLALPYLDGYEVLRQLKQNARYAAIPVVIISTSSNPVDRNNCLKLGANAYFSKPFNLQGYSELAHDLMQTELPRLMTHNHDHAYRPSRLT